ncbi:hypothetical protein UFOVP649_71 [uncultured Caudovirales phage]|jgi:hypothetical protein|uniref:Uncharacterized protein n=1 Tax=uncultured Caudovirales phage TaxID=2100421 RepID=A0A6J5NI75_9CAUD|nr:hypothetical protein UFOVP649_71 [uncultured Caudovirales phage]
MNNNFDVSQFVLFAMPIRPLISICIPPALKEDAEAIAFQEPLVHPAWTKLEQRGKHFVIRTRELDDITEVSDWARTALVEPMAPLSKRQRQAYQSVLDRTIRYADILPIGYCHCIATQWRERPLKRGTFARGDGSIKDIQKAIRKSYSLSH